MWHWFLIHLLQETGSQNSASRAYNFWSGFGSDIGEVVIIGGIVQLYRHHVCHVDHCFRLNRYPVDGTPYKTCRKHHPHVPTDKHKITADHIREVQENVLHPKPVKKAAAKKAAAKKGGDGHAHL